MAAVFWKKIDLLLLIIIPVVLGLQVSAVWIAGSLLNRQMPEALADTGPSGPNPDVFVQPLEDAVTSAPPSARPVDPMIQGQESAPVEAATVAITDKSVATAAVPPAPDTGTPAQPSEAETSEPPQQGESLEAGQQASPESVAIPEPEQCSCGLQDEAWLQRRDSARFTLQVYTASSPGRLLDFARNNDLPSPLAYYRTVWGDNQIYALVMGDHPDLQTAMTTVTELTARLPKLEPWVRRFGDIQTQIQ